MLGHAARMGLRAGEEWCSGAGQVGGEKGDPGILGWRQRGAKAEPQCAQCTSLSTELGFCLSPAPKILGSPWRAAGSHAGKAF